MGATWAPAGRVAVVTGASSGVGLATTVAAARAGFTAVGTVRDGRGEDALRAAARQAGVAVDARRLEVTDQASVDACVRGVVDTYGRIDALVNNAGVANSSPTLELSTMEQLRAQMEVNFFGVVAVSRSVLPWLRATRGRLVTVGSVRGVVGQPFNEAYSAAKFAVEGFMEALAPVAAEVGVTVCVVQPAAVLDTAFIRSSTLDPAAVLAAAGPYAPAYRAYRDWVVGQAAQGGQSAAEVAEVVLHAITAPRPAFRIQTSGWARDYVARKLADVDGSAIGALTRSWVAPPPAPEGARPEN